MLPSVAAALALALVPPYFQTAGAPVETAPPAAEEPDEPAEPPSRALLRGLTRRSRVAGTSGSAWGADRVVEQLVEAGWAVERDEREVLLSLPRRIEVALHDGEGAELSRRVERWDPEADPPGPIPPCLAWAATGSVRAPAVDAGHGLRRDFERLIEAGIELEGTIAIARYGGSYRGVKAALAEEYDCAALLLYSHPEDDGAERGATWPDGPWKTDDHCQRGSILPIANTPGDPSTPGSASPAPGEVAPRADAAARDALLPTIPAAPIPWSEAREVLARLDGLGPGPAEVELVLDQPRELRTIVNVIARMDGAGEDLVVAGNHRDSWVRGAHDAGGGTVALLRAAERLAERREAGWTPPCEVVLAFWDAEETGLIGSTEWVEAHANELHERLVAYVNADAAVSGPHFARASGTPGLEQPLHAALATIPATERANQLERWRALHGGPPELAFAGSGSDYTAFLHHLCLPVIDFSFGGNSGGQYHTAFDDFELVDRFLDPGFVGHERAGAFLAELIARIAEEGRAAFDEAHCCARIAELARGATDLLGAERARRLATAFETLGETLAASEQGLRGRLLAELAVEDGLPGRPWFRNAPWAPGLETGYAPEAFPALAHASRAGEGALDAALAERIERLRTLERRVLVEALDVRLEER